MTDKWLSIWTYNGETSYDIFDKITHKLLKNISEDEYKQICDKYELKLLSDELTTGFRPNMYQILNKQ